jgi:arylsulfatase A-like enzyme
MELPPNYSVPLGEDEPIAYRVRRNFDRRLRPHGIDLSTDDGWRRLIANYWGNITHIDRAVGGILGTLEELGLADDTIVVYTSDHGDMMGSHSMCRKEVMYEQAVKVPLLLRVPRLGKTQKVVKGRFSQIDLVPTVLELMGKTAPDDLPGRSLLPALRKGRGEEPVFIEWHPGRGDDGGGKEGEAPSGDVPEAGRNDAAIAELLAADPKVSKEEVQRAVGARTRAVIDAPGWKQCLSDADKHQLFQLDRDPWETHNLFYSGRHDDVIRRLAREIHAWQKRVEDPVAVEPT